MTTAPSTTRTLRFGHSPDSDDAFMFYGFHTGEALIEGCRVEHVLEDIQSLNRRALERADLEITAVSAHAYAFLAGRYAVLSCGASMGLGYGPVVVAREGQNGWLLRARSPDGGLGDAVVEAVQVILVNPALEKRWPPQTHGVRPFVVVR